MLARHFSRYFSLLWNYFNDTDGIVQHNFSSLILPPRPGFFSRRRFAYGPPAASDDDTAGCWWLVTCCLGHTSAEKASIFAQRSVAIRIRIAVLHHTCRASCGGIILRHSRYAS